MRRILISFASAVLLAVCNAPSARAVLVVNEWTFGTGILDFAPGGGVAQDFTIVVENPFEGSHFASYQGSATIATYDFAWLLDEAHFDISTSHHLAQLDGETITSGRIYLTPSVDSLVTFSGNWQYAWPSVTLGDTFVGMDILDVTDPENAILIAGDTAHGGNFDLGPSFGMLSIGDNGVIQSGRTYLLSYVAIVFHYDPTPPGTFGEASGDFHFTITPVPEPAAGLLALAALSPRRPRKVPTV